MEADGTQQANDQVDMEINDSRPVIQLSPVRSPITCIIDFLLTKASHRYTVTIGVVSNYNTGQVRDTMLIEAQENGENRPEDIILHVRDLTDVAPLPNLLLEDSNSTNSENNCHNPTEDDSSNI
jgi:hypothetical protein